jgi:hypothetical protein
VHPDPLGGGHVLLRAFPKPGPDARKALKSVDDLDYGDLVRVFIEWAALRLHGAASPEPTPLRVALLALKGEGWDAFGWHAWDQLFIAQPHSRVGMLEQLRGRLAALLGLWQHAAAEPPMYWPGVAWKAFRAWRAVKDGASADDEPTPEAALEAAAKAAHEAMDGGWGGQGGVRSHAPGYNRLLARGIEFRLDDDGAPVPALQGLLDYAIQLDGLIRLDAGVPKEGGHD